MNFTQVRKEGGFGVEDTDVGGRVGRDLAMEVQDHVNFFHSGEDWVVGLIRLDAALRVGSHSTGVRFDT